MIGEALSINPKVAEILLDKGVHCIGCGGLSFETLEMGLKAHGMPNKEIDKLIKNIRGAGTVLLGNKSKKRYQHANAQTAQKTADKPQ